MSTGSFQQETVGQQAEDAVRAAAVSPSAVDPSTLFGLVAPMPALGNWPWPAGGLNPVETAGGSLAGLTGCASMTFGLIVNKLKEALPDSIWQVIGRRQLKRAFNGGGLPGTDCGGIQATIVMMTLVGAPLPIKLEFYRWYCTFAFPSTEWDDLYPVKNTVQTVSRSPLCHESRNAWELAFNREVYPVTGVYDATRCSKVPRDCAKKAVELINRFQLARGPQPWPCEAH